MASDRVIIIRIRGIGFASDLSQPLTLTSRPLSYLQATAIPGVVTELTTQMSSEIGIFASMGSDPTTTFSVLANTQTLSALMSRGAAEVRGFDESSVQTLEYVIPSPSPIIKVTDASTLAQNDIIRINGVAYRIEASDGLTPGLIQAEMAYGSVPAPIPVRTVGEEAIGSTLYASYWQGLDYPTGGAEQQAVTISTVDIDAVSAAAETVVFRGVVSRVSLQTSAGTDNQIAVECMSLMGVIKNAPWAPSSAGLNIYIIPSDVRQISGERSDGSIFYTGVIETTPNGNMTGPIFEQAQQPYTTRFGSMQVRSGKFGGVSGIVDAQNGVLTLAAAPYDPNLAEMTATGFQLMFNDGYYRAYNSAAGDNIDIALTAQSIGILRAARRSRSTTPVRLQVEPGFVAEIAFIAQDFESAIVDLIFGSFDTNNSGNLGVRAWGMSAWIPFPFADIADIIDTGSLFAAMRSAEMNADIPTCEMYNVVSHGREPVVVLPVKPDGPATIGEVLDNIMKNLGVFMVYDKGRISFGRWASENPFPTPIYDTDFAEPKVGLTFDRSNSIQVVTVEYPAVIAADKLALTKNNVANVERITSGAGKIVTVGSMMQRGDDYQAGTIGSFAFINGTNMVLRYSQAAGILEVTLRDETKELAIGQYVAFSSEFIVNGAGTMGVSNATGIVLKATRSWQTPTTSYTLFLPGYLGAANRVSTVGVSGRVMSVPLTTQVEIDAHVFTSIYAQLGAPVSDPDAFNQTLQRVTSIPQNFHCALYDEYGTPYGITARLLSVAGSILQFNSSAFDVAIAGDIIVMDVASSVFSGNPVDLEECWDAFQADTSGQVNASQLFAYPWSR